MAFRRSSTATSTTIVLAPTAAGCPGAPGLAAAPFAVASQLRGVGAEVRTLSITKPTVAAAVSTVADAAVQLVAAGRIPIIVGGDHTVALGGISGVRAGLAREASAPAPPLFVLWLDAHPDVNTPGTSPSGNPHGMVLSGLLGAGPFALDPPIEPACVVLAGVRAFDPGELAFLRARPEVEHWEPGALRGPGWRRHARSLLRRIAQRGGRLYVSVDIDVFDPDVAPGVVAPVRDGAHVQPTLDLLRMTRRSTAFAGADVVEVCPPLDDGRTVTLAACVVDILGGSATVSAESTTARTPVASRRHRERVDAAG